MPTAAPWTTGDLAGRIRSALDRADEPDALRCIFELLDDFLAAGAEIRARLIAEPPARTVDARFDAFLGALVEHLAFHHGLDVPRWVIGRERFVGGATAGYN